MSMVKIRRIHDFQHSFSFSTQEEQFDAFYARFLEGELGKIYMAVPWDGLVGAFGLRESKKGPLSVFSAKGKLALMPPLAQGKLIASASVTHVPYRVS